MERPKYAHLRTRREFIRQAACAALGTFALTNTISDLRIINAAMAQGAPLDYKALVCIFLAGGNDSNNLIVPTSTVDYDDYAAIRQVLALPKSSLLGITPLNSDGRTYGFHPACPEFQTLFQEGKLAALFNVGTLVQPVTRAQYLAGTYLPPQLFSHSDQVTQWQTSIPDQPAVTGWGGRCADLLNSVQPDAKISLSVSLNGSNTFEVGRVVQQYSVSTAGAVVMSGVTGNRLQAVKDILALNHVNLQRNAYAGITNRAIATGDLLNTSIAATLDPTDVSYTNQNFNTPWRWQTGLTGIYSNGTPGGFPNTTLGTQLKMVARLIAAKDSLSMKRQIFFSSVGGYDTHTAQTTTGDTLTGAHANLLNEISQCMFAFQRAMEQLGLSNNVTQFTASDFGRTLTTNGQGSDHGWGGHQVVIGGAARGQRTYGSFPILAVNGPDDTSTGRWIPSTSVDQYSATLAKWFGVSSSDLSTVFPNIGRFTNADLGFMS